MEENLERELRQAQEVYRMVVEFFVNYSFQILGAIIILLIGLFIARKVGNFIMKLCEKKGLDITLSQFIASTAKIIVIVMVAIVALGKIGISVTPFLAAVGALSLGVGLAAQGLLANYGAGLNIILTRPYVVGDTITVQGVTGQVQAVQLAFTVLTDEDGVRITIPNRHIIGEILHNSFTYKLAELSVCIAYREDPEQVVKLINGALAEVRGITGKEVNGITGNEARGITDNEIRSVTDNKAPQVGIEAFAERGIMIGIRVWLPTRQYYGQLYETNRKIYAALQAERVAIALPQQELRILNSNQRSAVYAPAD